MLSSMVLVGIQIHRKSKGRDKQAEGNSIRASEETRASGLTGTSRKGWGLK